MDDGNDQALRCQFGRFQQGVRSWSLESHFLLDFRGEVVP
jgi:hypothetical protein